MKQTSLDVSLQEIGDLPSHPQGQVNVAPSDGRHPMKEKKVLGDSAFLSGDERVSNLVMTSDALVMVLSRVRVLGPYVWTCVET